MFSKPAYLASAALLAGIASHGENFMPGADFSHLAFFESKGVVYRQGGQPRDAICILTNLGITCVRLRLFTSSEAQAQADPYNYINNLDYTLPLAVRVKAAGLKFVLDFHYSDTWADPGKQHKPAAWTNLDFPQLVLQMREYNSNSIAAFKAAGAMPDYVQVGNEITSGLLWPDGAVGGTNDNPTQWSKLGQLLDAAIQGVKDASGPQAPKIIVHIDRGGDWSGTQWFFDHLNQQSVPFDIIGESYYPFWHGTLSDLAGCLDNAANRYHKPILVAETAFPWTNSYWKSDINGLSPGVNGQVQYVAALAEVVKHVPDGLGAGILWWGTEYQKVRGVHEAGFNTTSFFDDGGNVLPVAEVFGQLAAPVVLHAALNGGSFAVSWPSSGVGMSLTTSTSLTAFTGWLPVTNPAVTTGAMFNLTLPTDAGQGHFYRLQSDH